MESVAHVLGSWFGRGWKKPPHRWYVDVVSRGVTRPSRPMVASFLSDGEGAALLHEGGIVAR